MIISIEIIKYFFLYFFISINFLYAYTNEKLLNGIGLKTIHYMDEKRNRPLIADIYYPVAQQEIHTQLSGCMIRKPVAYNVPLLQTSTSYPLIIISHGYGGSREYLTWIAEALCEAGYIVAAIDHFGNTSYFDTPQIALKRWLRPQDITIFLDKFLQDNHWKSVIDKEKIGFVGFSLGGLTGIWLAGGIADNFKKPIIGQSSIYELAKNATEADVKNIDYSQAALSYRDKRIKAIFLMAPAHGFSFSKKGLQGIDIPTYIIVGQNDQIAPADINATHYSRSIPEAKLEIIEGEDKGHLIFRNQIYADSVKYISPYDFEIDPKINLEIIHQETSKKAIKFFSNSLKH